jgi:predicted N-acetyltransferase YhbS
VISALDQEFIFGKQRSLSLSQRFPHTLALSNLEMIRVAEFNNVICGLLAIRTFDWIVKERTRRGAMIGMVWVDPQFRGRGIGTNLLSSSAQFLETKGVDFAVLWTGSPAFYEQARWVSDDHGLFGEIPSPAPTVNKTNVSCFPLINMDPVRLECVRSELAPMRVHRDSAAYASIPVPANRVLCFQADTGDGGFALVGEKDSTGYFYEMVAPCGDWSSLWTGITNRFSRIFLNVKSGDPFAEWLGENTPVQWRPQNKTMWLGLRSRIENHLGERWYIPYFDWI